MKTRLIAVLMMVGLLLAAGGTAWAGSCPPEFQFGCTLSGSTANEGLSIRNSHITGIGLKGSGSWGVYGESIGGGRDDSRGIGVVGKSPDGTGVNGEGRKYGITGFALSTGTGVYGGGITGVSGRGDTGVFGRGDNGNGVWGWSTIRTGSGVFGENYANGNGVTGRSSEYGTAVYGDNTNALGWAGYFNGKVHINGNLSKLSGSFKIDHPLDPANKYLYHSFVESPDMLNIYNGNTTTDAQGEATVELPTYFEALNRDFRYQLTVVGQFAQAIVASEVKDNRFTIKTDKPNVRVSWQVTGIRHDPYAEQNRIQTEVEKPAAERGTYLYPQGYGQPETRGADYQRLQQLRSTAQRQPAAPSR